MTSVVLAGGRSVRFGSDKLLARVGGRTSLGRVVSRVRSFSSEVMVVTSSEARAAELGPRLPGGVRLLIDRDDEWGPGPAGAIGRTLRSFRSRPILFLPGDVPWIETRALARFVALADRSGADVATPEWGDGGLEILFQFHASRVGFEPYVRPSAATHRGIRASEFLRAAPRTACIPVRRLTSDAATFGHLTYAEDRDRPPTPRGTLGRRDLVRMVEGVPKRHYREGHALWRGGRLTEASRAFRCEARWYAKAGLPPLARHARDDARATVNRTRSVGADP